MSGFRILILIFLSCAAVARGASQADPGGVEYFEKRVRPILVERCHDCHSRSAEKIKGGLVMDNRDDLIRGGDTGPAIDVEAPIRSLIGKAISYDDADLQMPPKGKLPEHEIEILVQWLSKGAPWPQSQPVSGPVSEEFNLAQRAKEHWAWQPIQRFEPPAVRDTSWPKNEIDHFILARLEGHDLRPAPQADPRVLSRRLSFALAGLPLSGSLKDRHAADELYPRKLADLLLASPQFGERWARHWLDRVRYAETLGHEFDYPIEGAWRYRDYVIRALNSDLPYDQFAREHVAGDLQETPRIDPETGVNESIIAPSFFWFGQQVHSPVDVLVHQADMIDNQIDVLSKAFMGLTVSCARCHDHKFDAISTEDYYRMFGVLESSRFAARPVNAQTRQDAIVEMERLKDSIGAGLEQRWDVQLNKLDRYLAAAVDDSREEAPANDTALDADLAARWARALDGVTGPVAVEAILKDIKIHEFAPKHFDGVTDLARVTEWLTTGEAFQRLGNGGWFFPPASDEPFVRITAAPSLHSATLSRRLEGGARSKDFTITNNYLHLLVSGGDSRVNVIIANFTLIRAPIYNGLKQFINDADPKWRTIDLSMWQGRTAYLELLDVPPADPADSVKPNGYSDKAYLHLRAAVLSDSPSPPIAEAPGAAHRGMDAGQFVTLARRGFDIWLARKDGIAIQAEPNDWLALVVFDWLAAKNLLLAGGDVEWLRAQRADLAALEDQLKPLHYIASMADGPGFDERVFIRGSPHNRGEIARRGFLTAIAGHDQPPIKAGSGREELANWLVSMDNPFTSRVIVNYVWSKLMGRGLVASPDDFGVMGEKPTHPELLDWLAWRFMEDGWSIKSLVRMIVNSATYQMASETDDPRAKEIDPANDLLHSMRLRRLEAEAIRDSILSVSGRLDPEMFGPSVAVHLTPFMEGRGRPGTSGPLDGDGRRSIYVEVRRNFLQPMMVAFDAPVPFTTTGKRTASNVPAQALTLLNSEFIQQQASLWARKVLANGGKSIESRVQKMFSEAFGRRATSEELDDIKAFLEEQSAMNARQIATGEIELIAWTSLAHVLLNSKEFIYVR